MPTTEPTTQTAKILAIDDNVPILKLYNAAFKPLFDVAVAKDFTEVKNIQPETSFRYIITDYNLPDVPFSNLMAYLKETFKDARIILISGSDKIAELRETYKNDCIAVLGKPVDILNVRAMLQS